MGCIVNGPGEMADADYGYVGAGRGKISLYRQKECVEKNIPEEEAVEHLLRLIQETQPNPKTHPNPPCLGRESDVARIKKVLPVKGGLFYYLLSVDMNSLPKQGGQGWVSFYVFK